MLGPLPRSLVLLLWVTGCQPSAASTTSPTSPQISDSSAEASPPHPQGHAEPNAHHDGRRHHRHHRFEDAEQWAKMFDDPSRVEWQRPEEVIDYVAPAPNARIADLGAGTGYFAMRWARRVPQGQVFANDVEPDMVRYLTERAAKEGLDNVVAVEGSADDPRLPEPVDVVFLCNVFHHIENPDVFFGHVREGLRPGGRVVIVDFEKDAPEDAPGPPPAMRVAHDDLVATLAPIGLALVRSDRQRLPYQYIVELSVASE